MSRVLRFTAAALFAVAVAVPAPAAPRASEASPLAIVPASAPIVVHLRGVEGTKDRILALLKNALPELAPQAEAFFDEALKEGKYTDGRKLRGAAKDGPCYFVFTELPKPDVRTENNVAIIVAITDYKEFRDGVLKEDERKNLKTEPEGYEWADIGGPEPVCFVNKKNYVVVTPSKYVAKSFTKTQKGIDEHISKEQAARLLGDDVGVYVSMDALNKEYADQIKLAKEAAKDGLKALADNAQVGQRGALEMMQKLIDPAFQAAEDSRGIVFSAAFRPGGLALHMETELRPGTPTAKALEGNKLSAFKGLDAMPAGQMVYSGLQTSKSVMTTLGGMAFGMAVDTNSAEGKAVLAALDELVKADPRTRLDAFGFPLQSVQVAHYGDPRKAMEAQLKLVETLTSGATFAGGKLKEKPKVTPKAERFGDIEFTSLELKWDVEKMFANEDVPVPAETKKQLAETAKKLFGEGQTTWIGTDGKVVLQVAAKDWATAKKLLEEHAKGANGVGAQAAFRDVRKELPAEASMVALVDLVRYVGIILEFARPILEAMLPKVPTAPADLAPTYSGGAVTLKPDRASLDVFISAGTVHEIFKIYVQPLLGALGGAAN
jgi:hypothetical protein